MGSAATEAAEATGRLGVSVRRALQEATWSLASISTAAERNCLMGRFARAMELRPDGTITKKKSTVYLFTGPGK